MAEHIFLWLERAEQSTIDHEACTFFVSSISRDLSSTSLARKF